MLGTGPGAFGSVPSMTYMPVEGHEGEPHVLATTCKQLNSDKPDLLVTQTPCMGPIDRLLPCR